MARKVEQYAGNTCVVDEKEASTEQLIRRTQRTNTFQLMVITDDKASLELAHFIEKIHLEGKTLIHGSRSTNSRAPWDDLSIEHKPYGSLLFDLGARCSLPGSRRARPGQGRCDG